MQIKAELIPIFCLIGTEDCWSIATTHLPSRKLVSLELSPNIPGLLAMSLCPLTPCRTAFTFPVQLKIKISKLCGHDSIHLFRTVSWPFSALFLSDFFIAYSRLLDDWLGITCPPSSVDVDPDEHTTFFMSQCTYYIGLWLRQAYSDSYLSYWSVNTWCLTLPWLDSRYAPSRDKFWMSKFLRPWLLFNEHTAVMPGDATP